eukprot:TRINITY_DN75628_c0_g1_i1.p1 TRINITY_DN75628_c0_g1~~TRINITY_DN75628_c0_g1_i1.p1  ORF type:complete len:563 (+),score=53.28 TRINITY_DN75628_c0_g1_i1:71-1759(+)
MGNVGSHQHPWSALDQGIRNNDAAGVASFLTRLAAARQGGEVQGCDRRMLKALRSFDVNKVLPKSDMTALQLAANHANLDILRLLLGTPLVNPDAANESGQTALHYAAGAQTPRCTSCVRELLTCMADPFVASAHGTTPLDIARSANCVCCVRMLENQTKLWQGWVDLEEKVLLIPTWRLKWLVLIRDRRPNTGNPRNGLVTSFTCFSCKRVKPLAYSVGEVVCSSCGTSNRVPVMLQLAMYDAPPGVTIPRSGEAPATSRPSHRITLPQDETSIEVTALEDTWWQAAANLLPRSRKKSDAGLSGGTRNFGLSLRIKERSGRVAVDHSIRVASQADRLQLIDFLKNTVVASYEGARATPSAPSLPQNRWAGSATLANGCQLGSVSTAIPATASGRWACPICTFVHTGSDADFLACIMCGCRRLQPGESPVLAPTTHFGCSVASLALPEATIELAPSAPPLSIAEGNDCTVVLQSPRPSQSEGSFNGKQQALGFGEAQPRNDGRADDETACPLCMDHLADSAVVPCGHMCGCHACLTAMKGVAGSLCPICRGPITMVIRIYKT